MTGSTGWPARRRALAPQSSIHSDAALWLAWRTAIGLDQSWTEKSAMARAGAMGSKARLAGVWVAPARIAAMPFSTTRVQAAASSAGWGADSGSFQTRELVMHRLP